MQNVARIKALHELSASVEKDAPPAEWFFMEEFCFMRTGFRLRFGF
jgi:hypothetical protein